MSIGGRGSEVERLLSELCTVLGYCAPLREAGRFEGLRSAGVDEFTDAVLRAEGLDPQAAQGPRRDVRQLVAKHFANWGTVT